MLQNFLTPTAVQPADYAPYQLGKALLTHAEGGHFPDLKAARIALIGTDADAADAVRRHLYALTDVALGAGLVDLGNLIHPKPDLLVSVARELLDSHIAVLLIGSDQAFTAALYQAYHLTEQLVNLALVDKTFDFTFDAQAAAHPAHYLNAILRQEKSYLFHLALIGYQRPYLNPRILQLLEQEQFDALRLGQIRDRISEAEPFIRDADIFSFDLSAMRLADAPAAAMASPSGLFTEEACKLAYYAGFSDKLTSAGFFGLSANGGHYTPTELRITYQLTAQIIWYCLEGFAHRTSDYPISTDGFVEYVVANKQLSFPISFWKSTRSNRWWMQIPLTAQSGHRYDRHRLVPCTYNDYVLACSEELPQRLISAFERFA